MDLESEFRQTGITRKTARRYATIVHTMIDKYGALTLENAKREIVYQLDTNSPANANCYIKAFKAYCRIANEDWHVFLKQKTETPTPKRVPRIQLARDICFIEPENTRKDHTKYSILFELMFLTGMRQGECRTLLAKNISDDEIIITKSKTGGGRRIAVPPFKHVQKRLMDYLDSIDTLYAFPSPTKPDEPLTDGAVRKEFRRRLERLGVKYTYTPHSFRSAFMTRNLRQGAVLFDVQDIVGHRKADTTAIYYRGNIDTQRELMKNDPASKTYLSPPDQLKLVIDDIRKSGILDNKFIHHEITERSIKIEIKGSEVQTTEDVTNRSTQDDKVGSVKIAIEY